MPYKLTLTKAERDAIDWVGGRYAHGDQLARLLCDFLPEHGFFEWDSDLDITFDVPEWAAWEIQEIGEEDNWACFSDDFVKKLEQFLARVV